MAMVLMTTLPVSGAAAARYRADAPVVLLVGQRADGYREALRSLGVRFRTARSAGRLADALKARPDGVIVSADAYPAPTVLTEAQVGALEAYARQGGRALLEYATSRGGSLFGVAFGPPVVAQHERIALTGRPGALAEAGLAPDHLFDEHQSHVLPAARLAPHADVPLWYGKWVGTYEVYRGELRKTLPFEHNVTIDLGRPVEVTSVRARFGGEETNYCPDHVTVLVCDEAMRPLKTLGERAGPWAAPCVMEVDARGASARYIRLVTRKRQVSPVTDFLMLGEVEVRDGEGTNVALGRPYRLDHFSHSEGWVAGPLTDGLIDGPWSDGRSVQVAMKEFGFEQDGGLNEATWPALVRLPVGAGEVSLLATRAGDFRAHHYRPTDRWEALCRGLVLGVLPPEARAGVAARYVHLEAFTSPRRWIPEGEPAQLVVRAPEGAVVTASSRSARVGKLARTKPGLWEAPVSAGEGRHSITVRARTAQGRAQAVVELWVADRQTAYRRAIERNMRWYLRSGVMPAADASSGVQSGLAISAFGGGKTENLPSAYRADCQAMTLEAFGLYAALDGDQAWLARACRLGDILVRMQFRDQSKASFGARPWLFENDETIWGDDSQRNASALIALYGLAGEASHLRSALSWVELAEHLAKEDSTIGWRAIQRTELDRIHRSGFRELQWEPYFRYDLLTRFEAWRATGDATYRTEAERLARLYADTDVLNMGAPAYVLTGDPAMKERVDRMWREYLADPDVRAVGAKRVGSEGEFRYAFHNDCSIITGADPLTDQLYVTGWAALNAWRAHKGTGSAAARQAALAVCDYLVRIQSESPDPRVDGAWFRGFDFERWEVAGAPYDPNYGPYHAYTGWMNAIIDQALASVLLDHDPLRPLDGRWEQAAKVLAEVRAIRVPDPVDLRSNLARGRPYVLEPAPDGPAPDDGARLVDGVIDGRLEDGQSVTWRSPEPGGAVTVEMTIDLGAERRVAMVGQRYGALDARRLPDSLEVLAGPSLDRLEVVGSRRVGPGVRWSAWKVLRPTLARYVRLRVTKHGKAGENLLAIGETVVCAASEETPAAAP